MKIKHDNIVYISNISQLGGVETWAYQIAKKYKDTDVAVVCKTADDKQRQRLSQLCPVYIHTNQRIECKVLVTNYDNSILDYLDNPEQTLKCATIHGDYCNEAYTEYPVIDPRYDKWLAVTQYIARTFSEKFGVETELCYNPLDVDEDIGKRPLILISATRLTEIKGRDRMKMLAKEMDNSGIPYIWFIFSNDTLEQNDEEPRVSPNIIYMEPRLDVSIFMNIADYLVQVSNNEALPYSINEMTYRNKPVIVTPLPFLEEIGLKDNENCYILNFDCSNIKDVVAKIQNIPKFKYERLKDNYDNVFVLNSKSRYEQIKKTKYKVRATHKYEQIAFVDNELGYIPIAGDEWEVDFYRYQTLESQGYVTLVEKLKGSLEDISNTEPDIIVNKDIQVYGDTPKEADKIDIKELKKLKKADLIEKAHEYGVEIIDDTLTKDQIIELITGGIYG